MRIGIDARALGGRFTGDRTYWRGLIQALAVVDHANEYRLYLREPLSSSDTMTLPERFSTRVVTAKSNRFWSLWTLPRAAHADRVDLVHVQYSVSPLFQMPVVTTIHDITFRLLPRSFSLKDRLLLNLTIPSAIRRASRVLTVSEATKRDIVREYRAPESKIVATPLAADNAYQPLDDAQTAHAREALRGSYGIEGPYALAVGVLQPRKNLPMLISAFRTARRVFKLEHKLVIVGKRGWLTTSIDSALKEAAGDVVLTGYVPDEHLPLLYACADLMCYPSLYEGFGLPPLEAMACGCPVAVSNTSSLPEVVGDAGALLDPTSAGVWIDAIGRILCNADESARMREAGLRQAARFDWKQTALRTLEVYRDCAG
jgi:glycosyltransferase involved in cell wall biosynthesis